MSEALKGIIAGSVIGGCVLVSILILLCILYQKRRRRKSIEEYEKILPEHQPVPQLQIDPKSMDMSQLSMKTIAFTVPSAGTTPVMTRRENSTTSRSGDSVASDGDLTESLNSPSVSEVSSPSYSVGKLSDVSNTGTIGFSLGAIDPSLYKEFDEDDHTTFSDGHLGRIWFAIEYERESEKLLVTLIKVKNLPSRVAGSNNGCDPFVRLFLIPDERRYLQSKFKKKTCNPKFEESFVFQVSHKSLEERVLKLTVYDVDKYKRHNVIGHALYPLKETDLFSDDKVVIWRDLERDVVETTSDRGEMNVALTYNNHLERLTVGIFEGKNFKAMQGSAYVDSYVKINLLIQNKSTKSKRTEIIKKKENPTFNESFTFKLPASKLDNTSIIITAIQHVHGNKDKQIGRVVLGSFMFARGKELQHWNEMITNQRQQVTHWHVLS